MALSKQNRRTFLKVTALAGGGLFLQFDWAIAHPDTPSASPLRLNGFIKIDPDGLITIMSPNPEGGQNVKTSMPMIVAEELDADWNQVVVEQAPLDTDTYTRQFIGGSQAIRRGWETLREAGATARQMLREAAASKWQVPAGEITTRESFLFHEATNKRASYGEMATLAAEQPIPADVQLKSPESFSIIGTSRKNVDAKNIITGKPLFGIDHRSEGMLIAMIVHPPAFGMKLQALDDTNARSMPGIRDIFTIKNMQDSYERQYFDTCTFTDLAVVVGNSTWEVMQAKKALEIQWEPFSEYSFQRNVFGNTLTVDVPAGLETTSQHMNLMKEAAANNASVQRRDGNPEEAFSGAAQIIERTYTAPFLAHNCMEPMNFYADVTPEKVHLKGPLQKPEYTEISVSERLGIPLEKIHIDMTRLGGGYGRRSYAHWLIEAAVISQKMKAPVKLIYTREDDMTSGIYRPMYQATYRAAIDANNQLVGFHVNAGGIPESPLYPNRFPAGAVKNYLAEDWNINSNITVGSFRAPRSNFIAGAEQSFLDEVAESIGKDPIEFRLELLRKAQEDPVGESNDYEPARLAGVLELVRDKSNWGKPGIQQGVAAYFCHNTYVAHVLEMEERNSAPHVTNVFSAVDCGIIINPDAARNMIEGAVVDGIGTAMYGALTLSNGVPDQSNFNTYRMIKMAEAPDNIEVHFVESEIAPTGMGEPGYPPIFGALAAALYKVTGKRMYDQPFTSNVENFQ